MTSIVIHSPLVRCEPHGGLHVGFDVLFRSAVLEEVGRLHDEPAAGLACKHHRLGGLDDIVHAAVLEHVHLVDAGKHRIGTARAPLGFGKVRVSERCRGEGFNYLDPEILVGLHEVHDLTAVVVHRRRTVLLDEIDVLLLVGQDVLVVGGLSEEAAGDIAADAMHVDARVVEGLGVGQAPLVGEGDELVVVLGLGEEHRVKLGVLGDQRAVVEGPVGAPGADDAVVADRLLHPLHAGPDHRGPGCRHLGLVLPCDLEVLGAVDGVPGAGVHESALAVLIDREVLGQRAVRRPDRRPLDHRVAILDLLHADLPGVGALRHVQSAVDDVERVVDAIQEPHEDVQAELLLGLEHLHVEGVEVPGINLGIELVQEVALVGDEEGHGHAVGHLSLEDLQETFSRCHA